MTFKVGDIVTGIAKREDKDSSFPYSVTSSEAEMEVTHVSDDEYIRVRVLKHSRNLSGSHDVHARWFKLVGVPCGINE